MDEWRHRLRSKARFFPPAILLHQGRRGGVWRLYLAPYVGEGRGLRLRKGPRYI
jgi:hypothetical protein